VAAAGVLGLHLGQFVSQEQLHHIFHARGLRFIIYGNAHVIKANQRAHADAADDKRSYLVACQQVNRNQAAAFAVSYIIYDAHLGDLAIDYIDESEAGAMAKVA
jgi:hypothetical protein